MTKKIKKLISSDDVESLFFQPLIVEDLHPEILQTIMNPNEAAYNEFGDHYINLDDTLLVEAVFFYARDNLAKINLFLKVNIKNLL